MKRTFVLIALLLAAVALSGPAVAQEAGRTFYVGGLGGFDISSDRDGASADGSITSLTDLDAGFLVGGFVGYRIPVEAAVGLRVEGEVTFRTNDVESFEIFNMEPSLNDDAMVNTVAVMGNVLVDFLPGDRLSPYGGGGVGFANMYQDLRYSLVDQKSDGNALAWQVMGGLSGRLTERLDVFGEARYFATADATIDRVAGGQTVGIDLRAEDFSVHGGIRINF